MKPWFFQLLHLAWGNPLHLTPWQAGISASLRKPELENRILIKIHLLIHVLPSIYIVIFRSHVHISAAFQLQAVAALPTQAT